MKYIEFIGIFILGVALGITVENIIARLLAIVGVVLYVKGSIWNSQSIK